MKLGIVGLPNVGKSTLFNALTNAGAEAASYPFSTITPNVGVVQVPDERLDWLTELYNTEKTTFATIEVVDIAGLIKGSSRGEGLGNKFLSHIRQTDALVHVVRCFDDENLFASEPADPERDVGILDLELVLADIEIVQRRIEKAKKSAKGDKKFLHEQEFFERLLAHLEEGRPARFYPFEQGEKDYLSDGGILSVKPVLYVANIGEDSVSEPESNTAYRALQAISRREGAQVMPICALMEQDIIGLEEDERSFFMEDLGIKETGLARLIKCSYDLLGYISFLTAGRPEVRAWTITKGTKAPRAAGKIHSDIERGFIRAETVAYDDLRSCGSMAAAREKGLVRREGKEYVMKDGDVVLFLFNV